MLYDTAIRSERAELLEFARAQRDLIGAVADFDARYSTTDVAGGARVATLGQVIDAHARFAGFDRTGEFYLARESAGAIDYVVPLRFSRPANSPAPEVGDRPMALALEGLTGTTVATDYRGERVLAAYTAVPAIGLGLVVKQDMSEIGAPFVTAALLAAFVTIALIAFGTLVARSINSPVVAELDEKTRLEVELDFARAVQEGLLPAGPPRLAGVRCSARTLPARFVSGDFYDFIDLDAMRIAIVIGDVSGKGVSAALLMARL